MKRLEVFDPAMCCASGVCGPEVDPKLVQFAADLDWLKAQGVIVQRHNRSQNPVAFVANETVKNALTEKGEAALPLLLVNGKIARSGVYPERSELAVLVKLNGGAASIFTPAVKELVAIGAAIAANCEPCLKYHYREAQLLGVSKADLARAVEMGAKVKDAPHQAILQLAQRLTGATQGLPVTEPDRCGEAQAAKGVEATESKCC